MDKGPPALDLALDHVLPAATSTPQGRNAGMKLDTYDRIELTGPWAGFGFQARHMWTPEGFTLYPEHMRWWSLTCNMAREYQLLLEQERLGRRSTDSDADPQSVVRMVQALHRQRYG